MSFDKATVFFASNLDSCSGQRVELLAIMQSAGMNIITDLSLASCSVHILSSDYGKCLENDPSTSISKSQFKEAKKKLAANPETFKMFIWYPPEVLAATKEPLQEEFINEIRNSITQNMVFTNIASPIQLVDDMRSMLSTEQKTKFDIKEAEVFLVFNQLDEGEADGIIDMLSDIVDVQKLNIVQDSDMDYSEFCSQQIEKSKLAVVYFKETADWALPFAKQIWKKVGGASSHTPILLIGDEDPDVKLNKKFKAPKVISLIVAGELIPLEIKVNYDKVLEGKF